MNYETATKEFYISKLNQVVEEFGLIGIRNIIHEIVDDSRLKQTFAVYYSEAEKGDKEAEILLIDHLAGFMFNERGKYLY